MSSRSFHCAFCKETCESREKWSRHLLTDNHQRIARDECCRWSPEAKRCAVIVYSSAPLINAADELLEYFSLRGGSLVMDFIWWPDKENVGLLQFENRETVEEIIREMGREFLQLPECNVQLKKATTCLDLEWNQLVQMNQEKDRNRASEEATVEDSSILQEDRSGVSSGDTDGKSDIEGNEDEESLQSSQFSDFTDSQDELSEELSDLFDLSSSSDDGENSSDILKLDGGMILSRAQCSSYVSQFLDLLKSIEMSKERFEIIDFVRTTLGAEYEVNLYQNWYLKFGSSEDILKLYVYISKPDIPEGFIEANQRIVLQKISKEITKGSILQGFIACKSTKSVLFNPTTGVSFSVRTDANFMIIVQMCGLAQYLCTFDPRVRPLLGLVYFWAKENGVSISSDRPPHFTCAAAGLDWLVILFLCKSGILPTVREIRERPHKPILVRDEKGRSQDVGFATDSKFAEEWRKKRPLPNYHERLSKNQSKEFVLDTLSLMKDFFHFATALKSGKWVLNARDAEIYHRDQFLKDMPNTTWSTKLSYHEVSGIKEYNDQIESQLKHLRRCDLYFIHPLLLTWRISVSEKAFKTEVSKIMKRTEDRLSLFLNDMVTNRFGSKGNLRNVLVCG